MPLPDGYPCKSCCSHGGMCVLDAGHDGKHDSGYCQWTDAEAISREEADRLCVERNPVLGTIITEIQRAAEAELDRMIASGTDF